MSAFLTELEIRCCPEDENLWELEEPLLYKSDLLTDPASSSSTSGLIAVPKGFITDLASTRHIPFVSLIWGSTAHREACLHDALYRSDVMVPGYEPGGISFSMANAIFREAMLSRDKGVFVRWPMFFGVWIGGYFSYHTKKMDWKPSDKVECEPPTDNRLVQP